MSPVALRCREDVEFAAKTMSFAELTVAVARTPSSSPATPPSVTSPVSEVSVAVPPIFRSAPPKSMESAVMSERFPTETVPFTETAPAASMLASFPTETSPFTAMPLLCVHVVRSSAVPVASATEVSAERSSEVVFSDAPPPSATEARFSLLRISAFVIEPMVTFTPSASSSAFVLTTESAFAEMFEAVVVPVKVSLPAAVAPSSEPARMTLSVSSSETEPTEMSFAAMMPWSRTSATLTEPLTAEITPLPIATFPR